MRILSKTLLLLLVFLFTFSCSHLQRNSEKELAAAYYNLGNAYYDLKKYDQAILYFQKALNLDKELVKAHYNLSLALVHNNKGDEANRWIEQLLERDPNNLELLHILGYSYYMQSRFTESLAIFDKILTLVPKNQDALYNKGIILWKIKKFEEAAELFKQVIGFVEAEGKATTTHTLYHKTLYSLGELLAEDKKWESSAFYLERYLELVKDDLAAHHLLIKNYRELEKYAQALETYDHLLTIDQDNAMAWLGKAEVLLTKVEDPVNGLAAFNRALMLGIKEDDSQLKQLVDAPDLIEKEKVKALLAERKKLTAQ